MAKAVKLSDIAEKLNVSTVTVSKALSGQRGMSDELRKEIINLANEMGYIKKTAIKEKENETKKSYNIGVLVAERFIEESQSFYWTLYQKISQKAIKRRCFVMLEIIEYKEEIQCREPVLISEKKVDGIIVMGDFHNEYIDFLKRILMDFPILYFDTTSGDSYGDYVVSNNLYGGYAMTKYLLDRGHKKIGFVGTRLATTSIDDRYMGYLKALRERGIEWRDDWVIDDRDKVYGNLDLGNGFVLPDDMPTAFFCNCDKAASILIAKLQNAGYSVPEDISVVGFDNYIMDQTADVGITTYEVNVKEMANRAVHIILHKIQNSSYSAGIFSIQGKIIERDSVKTIGEAVPYV